MQIKNIDKIVIEFIFFLESHWSPEMGVVSRNSTEKQVQLAIDILKKILFDKRLFLFINISAIHQQVPSFSMGLLLPRNSYT